MSTPAFVNTPTEFDEVRYFTEFDPYIYSVDNRPLQDLSLNLGVAAEAIDSARSNQMASDAINSALDAGIVGFDTHLLGLNATNPSIGVLSLSPGVLLVKSVVSVSDGREILKKASCPTTSLVSVSHPSVLGKEIRYLIQVRYRDFDSSTSFPGYRQDNPFSASGMLNGWLEISALAGAEGDVGASVAPTPSAGWLPVYDVTARAGDSTVTVAPATSSVTRTQKVMQASELSIEAFENSKSVNGYQKLPGGLIMQWGTISVPTGTAGATVTFPIAFPTACLNANASAQQTSSAVISTTLGSMTATTLNIRHGDAETQTVQWQAIGH